MYNIRNSKFSYNELYLRIHGEHLEYNKSQRLQFSFNCRLGNKHYLYSSLFCSFKKFSDFFLVTMSCPAGYSNGLVRKNHNILIVSYPL